jgi:tRNA (guanine26-N2/guanine27-N2)-dimethyltransferase
VHSKVPSVVEIHSALIRLGYRVSQFHHEPHAVKTDAPPKVVWDMMRQYCKLNPPLGSKHRKNNDVANSILDKVISTDIDFTPLASVVAARELDVARFPPNPEDNWGPKSKAGKSKKAKTLIVLDIEADRTKRSRVDFDDEGGDER